MGRSSLTAANSQAALDWADRKRKALEHANAIRAARAASESDQTPEQPPARRRAPSRREHPPPVAMDSLDQYMHGEAAGMIGASHQEPEQTYLPDESGPRGDAIDGFMGGIGSDILGGLEHIGSIARSSPPASQPQASKIREQTAAPPQQLTRVDSLSLLKKRNPNVTRRPRAPKVPGELVDAAKCGCCGQFVSECVDCNYCNRIFCRVHWENEVSQTGRCPSCNHRCSSYDCHDNPAVQQLVDLIKAANGRVDTPEQRDRSHREPEDQPTARVDPGSRRASLKENIKQPVAEQPPSRECHVGCDRGNQHQSDDGVNSGIAHGNTAKASKHGAHNHRVERPQRPESRGQPHMQVERSQLHTHAQETAGHSTEHPTEQPNDMVVLQQCRGCNRKFRPDVLEKHELKCLSKATAPKRKVFNAKSQSLAGTGAEKFIDKSGISGKSSAQKNEDKPVRGKVPKWKQQSEELKRAMRAEREYKQAVKQGKPPPPPPMSETVDDSLVPCPHCGRTFSEQAAERHIPKCKSQVNKPTRLMRDRKSVV